MAKPLMGPMPPNLQLGSGCKVRLNAIDPTTGAEISGVTVTGVSIFVNNVGDGTASDLESGPFMLVPGPAG